MFAGSVFPPSENPTFSCPSLNCATVVVVYNTQVPPTITSPPCNTQELLCAYQYLLLRQTCISCLQRNNKNEAGINLEKIAFSYNITTFLKRESNLHLAHLKCSVRVMCDVLFPVHA